MKMRWILVLLLVALLAGAGFWYYTVRQQKMERFVNDCIGRQGDMRKFWMALRAKDSEQCKDIGEPLKKKCIAFTRGDPLLCDNDVTCVAITTKNVSRCFDATCKAQASGNVSYCNEFEGPPREMCKNIVAMNVDYFAPNETTCKQASKNVI